MVAKDPYAVQIGGSHYKQFAIQPHEYIVRNGIGWSAGNAIKYLSRYKQKGGAADVKKAIHYCMMLLKEEYGETYSDHIERESEGASRVEVRDLDKTERPSKSAGRHDYDSPINTCRYY